MHSGKPARGWIGPTGRDQGRAVADGGGRARDPAAVDNRGLRRHAPPDALPETALGGELLERGGTAATAAAASAAEHAVHGRREEGVRRERVPESAAAREPEVVLWQLRRRREAGRRAGGRRLFSAANDTMNPAPWRKGQRCVGSGTPAA